MPARKDADGRLRRRELLRLLLEEEEQAEAPTFGDADISALLRELQGIKNARPARSALMSSEQLQGFMWGVGAATLLLMVMPTAKQALRPFAVSTVKSAMDLMEQLKSLLGQAGEGLQDLFAEAQFQRMQEAVAPSPASAPAPAPEPPT